MKRNSYYLVSLGCAKNSVDSQSMAVLLDRDGYKAVEKPAQAEVLIVNTCGFIEQARQESMEVLADLARSKKTGQLLIAAGCFSQFTASEMCCRWGGACWWYRIPVVTPS